MRKKMHLVLFSFRKVYSTRSFTFLILFFCIGLIACEKESPIVQSRSASFIKMFGGAKSQFGSDVKNTPDGGYIILGSSNSFGGNDMDMYLIKVDAEGNEEWSNKFGSNKDDFGNALFVTKKGEYVLLGTTTDEMDSTDLFLVKVDILGQQVWEKKIGSKGFNETARMIKEDLDGQGYIIVGNTTKLDYGKYGSSPMIPETDVSDALIVRTDLLGNVILTRTQGFNGPDIAHDVLPVKNSLDADEYIFVGTTTRFSDGQAVNGSDIRLFKNNKSLGSNVEITHGGERNDTGMSICQTSDGGFAIVGSTFSYGNGEGDLFFVKLRLSKENEVVNIQNFTFGGTGEEKGQSVQQLEDGSFVILGTTSSRGNGGTDIYLLKVSASGEELWSRTFGDEGMDSASKIIITPDGGFAIIGTLKFTNNDMIYLIKTNSEGLLSPIED